MTQHANLRRYIATIICTLCFIGIAGCQFFDSHEELIPTSPQTGVDLLNYWANIEEDDAIGAYVHETGGLFSLQVPEGGVYRLSYTFERVEEGSTASSFHEDHIVFEALYNASLCIGLNNMDTLVDAVLEQGTLEEQQKPLHDTGKIRLFAWPYGWTGWPEGEPHPTDMALATVTDTQAIVENGALAAGIKQIDNHCKVLPTPTPTPPSTSTHSYTITVTIEPFFCPGAVTPPGLELPTFSTEPATQTFTHSGGPMTFTFTPLSEMEECQYVAAFTEESLLEGSFLFVDEKTTASNPFEYTISVNSDFTLRVIFAKRTPVPPEGV